ncbi:11121_t:CDS:2, partial [Gigaspora rosea]
MTLPLQKFNKEIDIIIAELLKILQEHYPHPESIFTCHLGTIKIVNKSNKHYFTNLKVSDFEKEKEEAICKAVFNQLYSILGESTFISLEKTLSKWYLNIVLVFLLDLTQGCLQQPSKIFEIHNQFKKHLAMDITAINLTMTWSYM